MKWRFSSLRMRLVVFVFVVMVASSVCTGTAYIIMLRANRLPPLFFAQMMSPVWLVCVSSVLGTAITAWFGRLYLSPIKQLIRATSRVAKGDFDVRLPEDGAGEMNELMHSFNDMARELGGIEMFRKDFINNFSHEFKTPIVSIRGFARQLLREDITAEQRAEYATIIVGESERLANMASNVLLLTKLENQQIVTEKTAFRLDEQLRGAILLLEKQWTRKNIDMNVELDEVTLRGNAEMLSQAWLNLLSNAVKFTPEGGSVSVTLTRTGDNVRVVIADTGVGMDEKTRAHIFEKFYQGETSHSSEGNGLGLALVKRILALSNGAIDVDSAPGKGSTFTVSLHDPQERQALPR